MSQPFQLAACAEMLWPDKPIHWRAARLHEMGFGELATMIGYEPPAVVEVPDGPPPESPRARTTRLMKEAVLKSEALALELPDDAAKPPADTGGEATPPSDGGN